MKKQPQRMCVSCRAMHPKKSLIRLVLSPEGEICLDPTGRKPGRGAYVCRNRTCLQQAIRQHRFDRNFKSRIDEAVVSSLTAELEALPAEPAEQEDTKVSEKPQASEKPQVPLKPQARRPE